MPGTMAISIKEIALIVVGLRGKGGNDDGDRLVVIALYFLSR